MTRCCCRICRHLSERRRLTIIDIMVTILHRNCRHFLFSFKSERNIKTTRRQFSTPSIQVFILQGLGHFNLLTNSRTCQEHLISLNNCTSCNNLHCLIIHVDCDAISISFRNDPIICIRTVTDYSRHLSQSGSCINCFWPNSILLISEMNREINLTGIQLTCKGVDSTIIVCLEPYVLVTDSSTTHKQFVCTKLFRTISLYVHFCRSYIRYHQTRTLKRSGDSKLHLTNGTGKLTKMIDQKFLQLLVSINT